MSAPAWLDQAILMYGYWVVLVAVALETMGVPFPGETSVLAAAIYAGTGAPLNIAWVITFAAVGAILGDNVGFTVGRYGGYPLVRRVLRALRVRENALDYSRRYFQRHGDKTVFIGRFFSVLRVTVAFLAGVNQMPRRVFFFWNAAGGVVWALVYGLLGYFLGRNLPLLDRVVRALGIGGGIVIGGGILALIALWVIRRRRARATLIPADESDASDASDEAPDEAPDEAEVSVRRRDERHDEGG